MDDTNRVSGKFITFSIQFLIVVSLITFSIDTLPNLSSGTKNILYIIEVIIVVIFTVEYITRILVANSIQQFLICLRTLPQPNPLAMQKVEKLISTGPYPMGPKNAGSTMIFIPP